MSSSYPLRSMRVRFAGETNVGRKRQHNEDSYYLPDEIPLAVVADGMGGHASGEVASKLAVDTISSHFRDTSLEGEITWPYKVDRADHFEANRLITAAKMANQKIWQSGQKNEEQRGMGTTLVATLFLLDKVYIAHVGDSRCYRIRERQIAQITEDHSLLNDYLRMKGLGPEDSDQFKHKNVIVRALGMKEYVSVDLTNDVPRMGDIYLLCSDGLYGMVEDERMMQIVLGEPDLDNACSKLIAAANANGGVNNITVILARMERS